MQVLFTVILAGMMAIREWRVLKGGQTKTPKCNVIFSGKRIRVRAVSNLQCGVKIEVLRILIGREIKGTHLHRTVH